MIERVLVSNSEVFTREIIRNKLLAIVSEMGIILARTSMSPIVYEVLDFACGICDREGRVIAQDNGLCLFTGTFRPQAESILAKFPAESMRHGDVYMTNSPYGGGTHNSDVALLMPIFHKNDLIGFGISVTHWTEMGGKVLGSLAPDSTEIFQEGLQLPQLQLYREGVINQAIVDIIEANVRLPMMSIGDLNAGVAAVRIADLRVSEVLTKYGVDLTLETFGSILEHGESMAIAALKRIPSGVYWASDVIDGDGVSDLPLPVQVEVTITPERFTLDFTGSAPQTVGPINCARGALLSACKTIFKAVTAPQETSNDGFFRPLEVIAPEGTVFTATRPSPTGWYFEASAYATELVWKALAAILPERLSAGSYLSLCGHYLGGRREDGSYWVLAGPQDGGWGASAKGDGESSLIATTDGDTYNYPAEVIETAFPLTMLRSTFNIEAGGGHGAFRGGFGSIREYRVDNPLGATLQASFGRSVNAPWGNDGGHEGTVSYFEVERPTGERVRGGRVTSLKIEAGDIVRIVTGNGGGWGPPAHRDPSLLDADLADGIVSAADALAIYGRDV
ncbi:hydantoinase B/oxoprolinase family protein [soil metagenome]